VALARKMTDIPYAMWRDGTEFDPQAVRGSAAAPQQAVTPGGLHPAGFTDKAVRT